MPEEVANSPSGVTDTQPKDPASASGSAQEPNAGSTNDTSEETKAAEPSQAPAPEDVTSAEPTPANVKPTDELNKPEEPSPSPTATPTTMIKVARSSAELADVAREVKPHGAPEAVIDALKHAKEESDTQEAKDTKPKKEEQPGDAIPLAPEAAPAIEVTEPAKTSEINRPTGKGPESPAVPSPSSVSRMQTPATPRTPYRFGRVSRAKKEETKEPKPESDITETPAASDQENTPSAVPEEITSAMAEATPSEEPSPSQEGLPAQEGENSQKSGGGIFSILCCCCSGAPASQENEITAADLKEELKGSSQEAGDTIVSADSAQPIALGNAPTHDTQLGTPAAESSAQEESAPESTPSVLVSTPTGAGRPLEKPEVMPPLPVAPALQEEAKEGLEEDVKYADYKARFPDTPEEELKKWANTTGCYLILDTAGNKFFTQWSRKSIPKALAFFTVNPECVEPTRQLNASEKIGLLVERGAIKKLCKTAMVAFCRHAAKYDGYFTLLNTTLWQDAGLGNLEVVWMNGDDTLSFTKRGTEPIDLEKIKPLAVAAVDNTFRLQGTKPRRRLHPKWNKQSFISTVRSITDSAYGEIDPRSKAPRT